MKISEHKMSDCVSAVSSDNYEKTIESFDWSVIDVDMKTYWEWM